MFMELVFFLKKKKKKKKKTIIATPSAYRESPICVWAAAALRFYIFYNTLPAFASTAAHGSSGLFSISIGGRYIYSTRQA